MKKILISFASGFGIGLLAGKFSSKLTEVFKKRIKGGKCFEGGLFKKKPIKKKNRYTTLGGSEDVEKKETSNKKKK